MRTSPLIVAVALFGASCAATAQSLPADFLNAMKDNSVTFVQDFTASDGTQGSILRDPNGGLFTAFPSAEGEGVIIGTLYDASLNDLASPHIAEINLELIESQTDAWFSVGNSDAPVVYVIDDPMCPYCHRQQLALQPAIEAGEIQVRHIMVGMLGERSREVAKAIMQSENPAEAYARHHENFDDGGLDVETVEKVPNTFDLDHNNQLMNDLGVSGTPAMFYRTADGNSDRVDGYIEDVSVILDAITL